MRDNPLERHIFGTYLGLRYGLATMAFALPILLWIGGYFHAGVRLQHSMSAYYYACTDGRSMRTWFVGTMFAVSACLFLYKGYRRAENVALSCAGVLALGVALFPMDWTAKTSGLTNASSVQACLLGVAPVTSGTSFHGRMHGICAVSFFLCIAFVSLFCASDTLPLIQDERRRERYRRRYHLTGAAMIGLPVFVFVVTQILHRYNYFVFSAEAGGIYAFSLYWLVKSREIKETDADWRAANGSLVRTRERRFALDKVKIVPTE